MLGLNLWLLALCVHLADSTVFTFTETGTEESTICCQITVTAYGGEDIGYFPGKTNFIVNGRQYNPHDYPLVDKGVKVRGVHMMILTTGHKTCHVKSIRNYDTWNSGIAAEELGKHLDDVTKGDLVVGISEDDASRYLAPGKENLESNGIRLNYSNSNYSSPWYRSAFGFIVRKGFPEGARVIQLRSGKGPLHMAFNATCSVLATTIRSVSKDLDPANTNPAISDMSTKNGPIQATSDSSLEAVTFKGMSANSTDSYKAPPDLSQQTKMILYIAVPAVTLILIIILVVAIICFIRYQQRKTQCRGKTDEPRRSDSDYEYELPTMIYKESRKEKWIIDEEGYCEIHEYANPV